MLWSTIDKREIGYPENWKYGSFMLHISSMLVVVRPTILLKFSRVEYFKHTHVNILIKLDFNLPLTINLDLKCTRFSHLMRSVLSRWHVEVSFMARLDNKKGALGFYVNISGIVRPTPFPSYLQSCSTIYVMNDKCQPPVVCKDSCALKYMPHCSSAWKLFH